MGRGHLPLGSRALRGRGVRTGVCPVGPEPGRGARKHWPFGGFSSCTMRVPARFQCPRRGWRLWRFPKFSTPVPLPHTHALAHTSTCHVPGQGLIDLRLWICLMSLLPGRPSRRAEVLYYLAAWLAAWQAWLLVADALHPRGFLGRLQVHPAK